MISYDFRDNCDFPGFEQHSRTNITSLGLLFRDLPRSIRAQDPIAVAAAPYASPSALEFRALLLNSLPAPSGNKQIPTALHPDLIGGLANLLFHHAASGKETASVAAMYCTITGVLASAYGLAHSARAGIALALEARYAGELPPREERFKHALQDILTPEQVWWTQYAGAIGYLIASVYPTGMVVGGKPILWLSSRFVEDLGKKGKEQGLETTIAVPRASLTDDGESAEDEEEEGESSADEEDDDEDPILGPSRVHRYARHLAKVGKRKNWVGGREGWGMKVRVIVAEQLSDL